MQSRVDNKYLFDVWGKIKHNIIISTNISTYDMENNHSMHAAMWEFIYL